MADSYKPLFHVNNSTRQFIQSLYHSDDLLKFQNKGETTLWHLFINKQQKTSASHSINCKDMQCLHLCFLMTSSLPRAISKMQKNRGGITIWWAQPNLKSLHCCLQLYITHHYSPWEASVDALAETSFPRHSWTRQMKQQKVFCTCFNFKLFLKKLKNKNLSIT